jgi:hypothetical protein
MRAALREGRYVAGSATSARRSGTGTNVSGSYLRLFLEVLGHGIKDAEPFAEFSRSTFADWVSWVQRRFEKAGRPAEKAKALAILTVSTIRGLALYSVATKNKRGAKQALSSFIQLSREQRGG